MQGSKMSDDNVIELGCVTRLDLPPEKILRAAISADLETVVIVGYDKDGNEYFASSVADGAQAMYHLQRGIWSLNKITDLGEEEGFPA
jgi:hypothetical protein